LTVAWYDKRDNVSMTVNFGDVSVRADPSGSMTGSSVNGIENGFRDNIESMYC